MAKQQIHIKEKDFKEIIKKLPYREQKVWKKEELYKEDLEEKIVNSKESMKIDIYFGIPWVLLYIINLAIGGFNYLTISIFVIGLVFFTYSFFKRGSYGLNKRRVKVCEELLEF